MADRVQQAVGDDPLQPRPGAALDHVSTDLRFPPSGAPASMGATSQADHRTEGGLDNPIPGVYYITRTTPAGRRTLHRGEACWRRPELNYVQLERHEEARAPETYHRLCHRCFPDELPAASESGTSSAGSAASWESLQYDAWQDSSGDDMWEPRRVHTRVRRARN